MGQTTQNARDSQQIVIAWVEPVALVDRGVRCQGNHGPPGFVAEFEPVEREHLPEGRQQFRPQLLVRPELSDQLVVEDRRIGIEPAERA